MDIETAPNVSYTWGLYEQNVSLEQLIESGYILSWSCKWIGSDKVYFDSIYNHKKEFKANPKDDSTIMKTLWTFLDEADIIVGHNGDGFDLKWINTSLVKYGFKPVSPYKTIDTLTVARRHFKFQSNKLEYIANFFGIGSKYKHPGFPMWKDCMNGKQEAWTNIEKYNKHDVYLLEGIYHKLKPFMNNHPNLALYGDLSDKLCPVCLSKNIHKDGIATTNMNKYQRYECNDCGKNFRGNKSLLTKEQKENLLRNT